MPRKEAAVGSGDRRETRAVGGGWRYSLPRRRCRSIRSRSCQLIFHTRPPSSGQGWISGPLDTNADKDKDNDTKMDLDTGVSRLIPSVQPCSDQGWICGFGRSDLWRELSWRDFFGWNWLIKHFKWARLSVSLFSKSAL